MTTQKQILLAKKTALFSFVIGTLIFGIYFLTSKWQLLFVGYGFIILAGIFNIIVLITTLTKAKNDSENRNKLLKTSGLILLNIPVLFVYVWIAMILIGNMRITFKNTTENKLTDIEIFGCETERISELEPNESKTVWVGITGDCSISLKYQENGESKNEIVAGYVTGGMGQKMKHNIGGENILEF
ncbi:hypothetical protein [Aestuariivivens sp. NBU2969]|uniref:hypothetical protein n=1 Tax=Aestuariivivens sp. NBU2969 TaxID=2873267 RepID=UPI001CBC2C7E|nr:hypothetical protein [Aestuariivivens sp. NBU2969]